MSSFVHYARHANLYDAALLATLVLVAIRAISLI